MNEKQIKAYKEAKAEIAMKKVMARIKEERENAETSLALIHLKENLNWYKDNVTNVCSGSRNGVIFKYNKQSFKNMRYNQILT